MHNLDAIKINLSTSGGIGLSVGRRLCFGGCFGLIGRCSLYFLCVLGVNLQRIIHLLGGNSLIFVLLGCILFFVHVCSLATAVG